MLVVALVVLVVLGGAVAIGGAALFGDGRGRALLVPVAAVGAVVLLAGAGLLLGGMGGSHDHESTPAPTPTAVRSPPTSPAAPAPAARPPRPLPPSAATGLPVVTVAATDDDRIAAYPVVDRLPPDGVVRVVARGFYELEPGGVAQCVMEPEAEVVCAPPSKVQFDGAGQADFQFVVSDQVDGGRCRAGRPTCLLRVTGSDSGRRATVQTVFVDDALSAAVTLGPATESGSGYRIAVTLGGLPAGTSGVAFVCGPPEAYDARRCADGGPGASFVVGGDGAGAATVVVDEVGTGSSRHGCGARHPCGVSVFVGDGHLAASAVPIRFPSGVGASYDTGRLATGLGIALALAAAVVLIALTTDWSKPTEAVAPELEGADLQVAASLDELFGTDDELDERDPIPG